MGSQKIVQLIGEEQLLKHYVQVWVQILITKLGLMNFTSFFSITDIF